MEKALESVPVYTNFTHKKRARTYSPIYVYNKRDIWQIDIVFCFTNKAMSAENHGYKYLLTCIDCFTKFAWGNL